MTIYEETDFYTIAIDEEVPCFHGMLRGYARSSEDFRAVMVKAYTYAAEHAKKYPRFYWLSDVRDLRIVIDEDIAWLVEWLNPRLVEAGITHMAAVQPMSFFGQFSVNEYAAMTDPSGLVISFFPDVEKAKAWLKSL
ncbi:hypothetical protein Q0590_13870 [Rhodocytophaga aerolata]|uniref:STAS/SEC14 domain-containing protein n=1 Tax=Rhodocytophaga aerolata TaxID=455078 RepID=A0ABT8R5H7_9BACT|nr:hypothetical protein [Rhodocytophaga aerolata]MDO1447351.1 hypothetical protein [Rhodocytophaga aerolata]